jgi:hypothetical protein
MSKISFRGAFRALRLLFMEIAGCSRQVKRCKWRTVRSRTSESLIYTSLSLSSRLNSFQRQHPVQLGANLSLMQLCKHRVPTSFIGEVRRHLMCSIHHSPLINLPTQHPPVRSRKSHCWTYTNLRLHCMPRQPIIPKTRSINPHTFSERENP